MGNKVNDRLLDMCSRHHPLNEPRDKARQPASNQDNHNGKYEMSDRMVRFKERHELIHYALPYALSFACSRTPAGVAIAEAQPGHSYITKRSVIVEAACIGEAERVARIQETEKTLRGPRRARN